MSLPEHDADTLAGLVGEYGYTTILDAMADIVRSEIRDWQRERGPKDAVQAIISDRQRTLEALQQAALDARG